MLGTFVSNKQANMNKMANKKIEEPPPPPQKRFSNEGLMDNMQINMESHKRKTRTKTEENIF